MNKDARFESERLFYRGIREQDTDCLVKWRSDPAVIRYFRQPVPVSKEGHLRWYRQSYLHNACRCDFLILDKATGQPVGTVGVNHLDVGQRSCEISYMIAEPAFQRRGYAIEAISAMMRHMAAQGICRFSAQIHQENQASIRTIRKLGFTPSGQQGHFLTYHKQEGSHALHPH